MKSLAQYGQENSARIENQFAAAVGAFILYGIHKESSFIGIELSSRLAAFGAELSDVFCSAAALPFSVCWSWFAAFRA